MNQTEELNYLRSSLTELEKRFSATVSRNIELVEQMQEMKKQVKDAQSLARQYALKWEQRTHGNPHRVDDQIKVFRANQIKDMRRIIPKGRR